LSSLSQGDDEDQRAGNRVSLKHLTLRLLVVPGEEAIANHIRVVVIQWHPTTTPTVANIWESISATGVTDTTWQ
jgi:hypothetical protein